MVLYENPYIGESLQHNKDKIIRRMKKGKVVLRLFCVTLPLGSHGILEIYPYYELQQKWFKEQNPMVIGLARRREEAFLLIQDIIGEVYANTGGFDVANYLKIEQGGLK